MAETKQVVVPPLPQPGSEYSRENEGAFRSILERALDEMADELRALRALVEAP